MDLVIIAIIVVYALVLISFLRTDGFSASRKTAEIIEHRNLFAPESASFTRARSKMPWLDPTVYYDTVKLANSGNLTSANVRGLFST